jgi:tetrahydromethanopterin S-methyltransferase subunit C
MAIVGVLGVGTHPAWWVIAVIGAIGWFISFRAFLHDSVEHAASVRWSGLWPKEDEQ